MTKLFREAEWQGELAPVSRLDQSQRKARCGGSNVIYRESTHECGFCRGLGQKPQGAKCPVCRGQGEVKVEPPVKNCAFCHGRGAARRGSSITCTACKGKGVISIKEPIVACHRCRGTGAELTNKLVCIACKGAGMVTADLGKTG